jgi:2-polyprenyl-3-methyl-5-hydroxy-6-metoxy-1,4-benzoquinol methylase
MLAHQRTSFGRMQAVSAISVSRFQNLSYDEFRRRAVDPTLSPAEKIGFPDAYRAGRSESILADIEQKLPALGSMHRRILDIGPGCGELARSLMERCQDRQHELVLIDSAEMLDQIPDQTNIIKRAGRFPEAIEGLDGAPYHAILCYSVIQYVFTEGNLFAFVDRCLSLLADGGRLLMGDVPNASMRKRFLSSPNGIRHHQHFMETEAPPVVEHLAIEPGQIDDGVLIGLLQRCRGFGFHAWLVPQDASLPMANRREDLLIEKP